MLIKTTEPGADVAIAGRVLEDDMLIDRLKCQLDSSSSDMLSGSMEAAATLCSILRIITNLITLKWSAIFCI